MSMAWGTTLPFSSGVGREEVLAFRLATCQRYEKEKGLPLLEKAPRIRSPVGLLFLAALGRSCLLLLLLFRLGRLASALISRLRRFGRRLFGRLNLFLLLLSSLLLLLLPTAADQQVHACGQKGYDERSHTRVCLPAKVRIFSHLQICSLPSSGAVLASGPPHGSSTSFYAWGPAPASPAGGRMGHPGRGGNRLHAPLL